MDQTTIQRILTDTAYVRTGGSPEELRCALYLQAECKKLGFKKIIIPKNNYEAVKDIKGIEIWPVDNLRQAINIVLGGNRE